LRKKNFSPLAKQQRDKAPKRAIKQFIEFEEKRALQKGFKFIN
jgi:hypothetical protein